MVKYSWKGGEIMNTINGFTIKLPNGYWLEELTNGVFRIFNDNENVCELYTTPQGHIAIASFNENTVYLDLTNKTIICGPLRKTKV